MSEPLDNSSDSLKKPGYDQRLSIPETLKPWDSPYPDYSPPDFTSETVLTTGIEQGWADPVSPEEVDFSSRPSFLGPLRFDEATGRPLNPRGRQGIAGRGELGKWGANNAADPIVIAKDPSGSRKILLIKRKDTGEWALPGGMVEWIDLHLKYH